MTGIKGKSGGKALTAEAKAKKAAAGASRGASQISTPLDPTARDPEKRLGLPVTWGDELKRRQVEGEAIQNRRREIEVQRAEVELENAKTEAQESRGRLVDRSELDKVAAIIRDAWWRESQRIPGEILAALTSLPIEDRERVKRAADAAIVSAAERVKKALTA